MGGVKGGLEFNLKGCSDNEIMCFCQVFMQELQCYIGLCIDVFVGDINVGVCEIGFLYGQYWCMYNEFGGSFIGKDIDFGGSYVCIEVIGFGLIYMLQCVFKYYDDVIEGKWIVILGVGNVVLYVVFKVVELGGIVISLFNSCGSLIKEEGLSSIDICWVIENCMNEDNIFIVLVDECGGSWFKGEKFWGCVCDVVLLCVIQNELDELLVKCLVDNYCKYLLEGVNMFIIYEVKMLIVDVGIVFVLGKVVNVGGVVMLGMEML